MRRFKHPWPRVPARKLGLGYDVVSEGLNGRTTMVDDPFMADYDVNGRRTLPPILHSHKPIDVLVIMLGTNDLKKHLNLSPQLIAKRGGDAGERRAVHGRRRSTPASCSSAQSARQPPPVEGGAYSFAHYRAKARRRVLAQRRSRTRGRAVKPPRGPGSAVAENFTKSFLGDDAAVLARSSGEEPASPRHRAGVASMAWRTTR